MKGQIKSFSPKHGYGFISADDGKEYFFHILQWKGTDHPEIGTWVLFSTIETRKGIRAKNVRRL